ncbi:DNA methyltransferase [Clostridium isatidis]|uniref:DNA methylase n=1 Tax=Clostridium isatidis TaxID=182773 RepID=A0A343JCW3_9CLOT|nr:DNA methyltransferase [Clostridium isatidis]ASW43371.1 DNA methylase [Clostridium isatidis]
MAKEYTEQLELFEDKSSKEGPVTCLGMTFESDEARRSYFTEELRKKLPELREIEGFPIGEDEDILALSDPPYYTACPNPFINDFINVWENEKKELNEGYEEEYHRQPFAADVSEGKNDPIYTAHSYHTKVPHKAIMRYILHYTNPGDIVLDAFSGTGMTGVAAQFCEDKKYIESLGINVLENDDIVDGEGAVSSKVGKRNSILYDLSPLATHISSTFNSSINLNEFQRYALKLIEDVNQKYGWMYLTNHTLENKTSINLGSEVVKGEINYVVWSEVFICPNCQEEVIFWDVAVDLENENVKDSFYCKKCNSNLTKDNMDRAFEVKFDELSKKTYKQVKRVPILINYSVGSKRYEKRPDQDDLKLISTIEEFQTDIFYPTNNLINGDEIGRLSALGIEYTFQFMSRRNNIIIGELLNQIKKSKFSKIGLFLLTASIPNLTWMYRWRANKKGGTTSGTYYICSTPQENNPLNQVSRKLMDIMKALNNGRVPVISTQSSSNLNIKKNSVDYIFTDPPFGANLMYSELNYLWESWLNLYTNNEREAIVNRFQGKKLDNYKELMRDCFENMYYVLKPGRWMTVAFSNSQASVWNAIQESIENAGFIIANVAALDKKQLSFKALTTTTAVKQDLVISAYKPSEQMFIEIKEGSNNEISVWSFIRNHLQQLPIFIGSKGNAELIVERTPRVLFDRMIAYYVRNGYSVPISSAEFQSGVVQRFPVRDGMVFLENQVAEYDKKRILAKEFVQMSLYVSDENSAIEWLRQQLMKKPQTRQDLHPNFMKELQHISKYEKLPELDTLLEQNFLKYDGIGPVPSQIHAYLSTNFKDLRELSKEDPKLQQKAKDRWYVPDPNKQADLEKLREKSLLREFNSYVEEIGKSKKKLKQFRLEAIRAGFKKAWGEKDYKTIVEVGGKIPENVLQEDDKLLMYYDNAQIRLGM